jgi:hypothetical protein
LYNEGSYLKMPYMYALFLSGIMEMVTVEPEQLGGQWAVELKTRKGFSTIFPERFTTQEEAMDYAKSLSRSYTAVHPMTVRHDPHGLAGRARSDED